MAFGKLAAGIEPAASTYKTLYKPATGKQAVVTVTAMNRATSARQIKIAVVQHASADQTPGDGDWVLIRSLAAAGDSNGKDFLSISNIPVSKAGEDQIIIWADGIDVSFVPLGMEESY